MDAAILHSVAGAFHPIEPSLLEQLIHIDQTYQLDRNSMAPIQRALSLLEAHHREDLMGVWAERAYDVRPDHPISLFAMASHFDRLGQPESAIPLWILYGQKQPDFDPLGLHLATALLHNGNLEEAKQAAAHAVSTCATGVSIPYWLGNSAEYSLRFHILLSEILLRLGDPSGFGHYVAQLALRMPHFHCPHIPLWNSEAHRPGHLLITPVGGYGDQLLFSALIPTIAAHFEQVTVAAHPDLCPLFQRALPQCHITATASATQLDALPSVELAAAIREACPTVQINMLLLPLLFAELAPTRPIIFSAYLAKNNAGDVGFKHAITNLKKQHPTKHCVGIAWDRAQRYFPEMVGGNEACRTARTSLPLQHLQRLLTDQEISEHIHFIALHEEGGPRKWPPAELPNFSSLSIQSGNFSQTAQLIQACDLVISVDMSIANLSAMLGTNTWVLLAREGDWRWGNSAATSPWIPPARLFRQDSPGDWDSVLRDIRSALVELSPRSMMNRGLQEFTAC